ncbi:shikimate kinase [Prevotella amnii]|uniref:Shikimate kinase n=1 Tax=Prevotella amnii DNF00058 TaxID=1401066 RepID=A0A096D3S7_9BACT|nr:shikimate kinase [Prevotella amnii]KGF52179.1 shikimate kinase [Prevotella amnii DNF00058]
MPIPLKKQLQNKGNTKQNTLRILLIGYMGAGKTTIGKALSDEMNIPFYDLDWYIEARMHRNIKQLFEERGEEGFRKIEQAMLHEVAENENVIIACGGGTPCFFDNMDYMNRQGTTVYLKAIPEVLYAHLKMGKTIRPLLLGKTEEEIGQLIVRQVAERESYYLKAKYVLNINLLSSAEKIKEAVYNLRELLNT